MRPLNPCAPTCTHLSTCTCPLICTSLHMHAYLYTPPTHACPLNPCMPLLPVCTHPCAPSSICMRPSWIHAFFFWICVSTSEVWGCYCGSSVAAIVDKVTSVYPIEGWHGVDPDQMNIRTWWTCWMDGCTDNLMWTYMYLWVLTLNHFMFVELLFYFILPFMPCIIFVKLDNLGAL